MASPVNIGERDRSLLNHVRPFGVHLGQLFFGRRFACQICQTFCSDARSFVAFTSAVDSYGSDLNVSWHRQRLHSMSLARSSVLAGLSAPICASNASCWAVSDLAMDPRLAWRARGVAASPEAPTIAARGESIPALRHHCADTCMVSATCEAASCSQPSIGFGPLDLRPTDQVLLGVIGFVLVQLQFELLQHQAGRQGILLSAPAFSWLR